jgi:hypothetical protein
VGSPSAGVVEFLCSSRCGDSQTGFGEVTNVAVRILLWVSRMPHVLVLVPMVVLV